MKTENRVNKITSVINTRQKSLRVVLENIHDPHNVSAIFRTCDAVGISDVYLVYYIEKFPKIGKKSSASAFKWVERIKFKSVSECYNKLHEEGFLIYASALSEDSKKIYELDLTKKIAFVFGNEHRGISEDAMKLADGKLSIPMYGMVQSLNVSVAAAVVLYEALRQRLKKGMYDSSEYLQEELEMKIKEWTSNK